jgi:transposase
MWYIGLDYHVRTSSVHILDANGKKVNAFSVRGSWVDLVRALREVAQAAAAVGEKLALCYEASCSYGHLYEQFAKLAAKVLVAHPGQLRLIFKSKHKHDRADAGKLAKLLFLDQVPTVWVPRQDVRAWRSLIEYRRRMIDQRTQSKNQLRALLRTHGILAPAGPKLWAKKQRPWLRSRELPTAIAALQRDLLLEELGRQEQQVNRVTQELDRLGAAHPGVALLQTIPGVGPRTAEAVVAYLDDVRRFRSAQCIGSYLGLVPCQDASAGKNRWGHITREGPPTVRKLLIEAAWQGIRRSPEIRAYYERIAGGKPERRKIALVATAHWLARVTAAMLRHNEAWRYPRTKPGAATPVEPPVPAPAPPRAAA